LLVDCSSGWLFGPLSSRPASFVAEIPNLLDQVADRFGGSSLAEFLASDEFHRQIQSALDSVTQFAEVSVGVVFGALASVLGVAFTTFTIAAVTVYLMLALPSLKSFAGRALGDEARVGVMAEAMRRVGGYVTGQLGICACAGITSSILFLILGVPYAALLGLVVAVLDAVPQVGATLGAIVAVAVALTQSIGTAVAVTIFFIIYQQLENFLIAPKVFSSAVALRPFTVFLAILIGGAIAGVVGVVMALPIAAALKVVFRHVFREQLSAIEGRAVPDLLAPG
jgi:predicted PurR-regulated permease PerM